MNDIKISLTIILPGGVMLTKAKARKDFKSNYNHEVMDVEWQEGNKPNGKPNMKHETIHIHTRKCIPAKQVINMSREAYYDMINKDNCPEFSKPSDWKKLNNRAKIALHCKEICDALGGTSFDFVIFDD